MSEELKIVTQENIFVEIHKYIKENDVKIQEFDDIKECIMNMMKDKYCLNVERERLRECMEDITYQIIPNDENKERILEGLEYEDEGDDLDLDFTINSTNDDEDK
tara:strand:- start:63 stop:377 length:315 start_codon:yes stop_codon:yes gene_type:complete